MDAPKRFTKFLLALSIITFAQSSWAGLKDDIDAVLADKSVAKTKAGVIVAKLGGSQAQVIYQHNAQTPLMPASNMKVLTTSAALDRFGSDFKYRTTLAYNAGDLALIGDGDPSLGDPDLAKGSGYTPTSTFEKWAEQLKSRGITSVKNLLVDDSIFDEQFFHPSWPESQAGAAYEAEVAGISLDANTANILIRPSSGKINYAVSPAAAIFEVANEGHIGSANKAWIHRDPKTNHLTIKGETKTAASYMVTVHDPPMYAASVLAEVLKSNGITVTGEITRDRNAHARNWPAIAVAETPIAMVISRCNKDSMNMYAESFCKRLGHVVSGEPGSWANGTAAVSDFVRSKCGGSDAQFHLDDGCGLSRKDNVSVETLMRVLAYDYYSKNREVFLKSLPVAGEDGTLHRRFQSDLKGRVFAKTGYINGVKSLSGYLQAKNGNWYVFSIIFNNIGLGAGNPAQEKIVAAIDRDE